VTGRLRVSDMRVIAQARDLADLHGSDAVRRHTGETDVTMAYAVALGEAQYYVRELSRIVNRLTEGDVGQDDEPGGLEPYCATCGALVGHFLGHGDGWHHFRGAGIAASPVELFDADHEPEVAWRPAGGQ
jgi:hypothetical protein